MAEMKQVVIYPLEDIQGILRNLNEELPVKGIEMMRAVVNIFDTLNKGVPQQASEITDENGNVTYDNPGEEAAPAAADVPVPVETGTVYDVNDETPEAVEVPEGFTATANDPFTNEESCDDGEPCQADEA